MVFIGEVRPLQALEIIHLWDNIENNVTSLALLLGFHQIVQDKKIKALFKRGLDMTNKAVKAIPGKTARGTPSITVIPRPFDYNIYIFTFFR